MLATRPSTSRSRSWASIASKSRARRPSRSAGWSGVGSDAIGVVRVVGEVHAAVLRYDEHVLGSVAAVALVPHDRFDHQDRAGLEDLAPVVGVAQVGRSEEHTSELQSLMRISYAVFCLKKKNKKYKT